MHAIDPRRLQRAASTALETLERRMMLTGLIKGVFDVNKVPQFTATSTVTSDLKHGPLAKSGGLVGEVYDEYQSFISHGGTAANFFSKLDKTLVLKKGMIGLTIRTRGGMPELADLIHSLGGELIDRASTLRVIEAYVPIANVPKLDTNKTITSANPLVQARTAKGIADNQADTAENADELRTAFNVGGAGVKVGVISGSVSQFGGGLADSVTTGDLPDNVEVIEDGSGGDDEGRAMLEEIHDIAPEASLAFATSGTSQLQTARNVTALADAGASVIVDDIGFLTEPIFQPGVISQAISTAVQNHDIVYLSAAGNNFESGYSAATNWVTSPNGERLVDFDPGGGVDTRMTINLSIPSVLALNWDDPYNGVIGAATSDLDIRLYDHATGLLLLQSTTNNIANGVPLEMLDTSNILFTPGVGLSGIDLEIRDVSTEPDVAPPTYFRIATEQPQAIFETEYDGIRNGTYGHSAGEDMLGVAAAPFFLQSNFQRGVPTTTEDFSATGPVYTFFKGNGDRLSKPITLLKPDLTGIDNVNTSFFGNQDSVKDGDKLLNFDGTSAAAPNVAAVAALLRQIDPSADSLTIRNALISAAKSNPINGAKAGEWERKSGYGLIDGLSAGLAISHVRPTSDIVDVFPQTSFHGPDSMQINFSKPVASLDVSDFTFTRNKGPNLLNGDQSLSTTDNMHWTLNGLYSVDSARGTYRLTLDTSNVVADNGRHPSPSLEQFIVNGKPSRVMATPVSPSQIDLTWTDNSSGESAFKIYRADDARFTIAVKTFTVPADVTKLQDKGLLTNYRYFYRVKAIFNALTSSSPRSAMADAFTLSQNELVVDNTPTKYVSVDGSWDTIPSTDGWSTDYLASRSNNSSVTFAPRIPKSGNYFVYARWVPGSDNATNVPVTVGGTPVVVNQQHGEGWQLLGTFPFNQGAIAKVVIGTGGANGTVVADAIRFQLANNDVILPSARASTVPLRPGAFSSGQPIHSDDDLSALI